MEDVAAASLQNLFTRSHAEWMMTLDERAALEGILVATKPSLALEIGTARGGSLDRISMHSAVVHSFDLVRHSELTDERFPNVNFHVGDDHQLLPALLDELAVAAATVDFVLVDGDHAARGVHCDLEDLLSSPCIADTVILVHDTINERVRAGLEQVTWQEFENVRFVDLDFLTGRLFRDERFCDELWGGFALIVTGDSSGEPPLMHLDSYEAPEVFDAFRRAQGRGEASGRPSYHEIARLERQVDDDRAYLTSILGSRSWRITKPLRHADELVHRIASRHGSGTQN
jgi:hypothetical protein